jgi:hypothetical protein
MNDPLNRRSGSKPYLRIIDLHRRRQPPARFVQESSMTARKTFAAGLAVAVAAASLAVAAVPTAASAQAYGCSSGNGSGTGAIIGGLGGAVAGNQLSARGRHTENTLIGGVLGAVAGAVIGSASHHTDCGPAAYSQNYYNGAPPPAYYNDGRYYDDRAYDNQGYDQRAYAAPPAPVYYAPPQVVYVEPAPVYYGPSVYFRGRIGGYGYGRGHRRW